MSETIRTDSGLADSQQLYRRAAARSRYGCGKKAYHSWRHAQHDAEQLNKRKKKHSRPAEVFRCVICEAHLGDGTIYHVGSTMRLPKHGKPLKQIGGEMDGDWDELPTQATRPLQHARRRTNRDD